MQTMVCQLHHKIDGRMKTAQGRHQDLAACFTWKKVGLGFPSLASRLVEARWQVVHVAPLWRLHEDQVEDGRVDAMVCIGPCYPYLSVFFVLGLRGILVLGVCQELYFHSNNQMREGGQ
jgi:hypothetical protein